MMDMEDDPVVKKKLKSEFITFYEDAPLLEEIVTPNLLGLTFTIIFINPHTFLSSCTYYFLKAFTDEFEDIHSVLFKNHTN
jgi:hypothetical protein